MKIASALALLVFMAGCSQPTPTKNAVPTISVSPYSAQDIITLACDELESLHFHIDKADPDQGILRTAPLSGAQWFELWRQDNVGLNAHLEANLQSLRRSVELSLTPTDHPQQLQCRVKVERLSFPTQTVASSTQTYRMLTKGTSDIQRLELNKNQEKQMAWQDLGDDPQLAQIICNRIKAKLTDLNQGS